MNNDPSSEPYDWSLKPSSAHPGTSVYSTMTPTQPRVYPAQDLLSPTHQAMQQIDTPMARAYHIAAPESSPSSPGEYRPRALPSPHRFNTNLPDKRPRLLSTADNRTVETGDELETSADRNVCLWSGNLLDLRDLILVCRISADTHNDVRAPNLRKCSPSWVARPRVWTPRAWSVPAQNI